MILFEVATEVETELSGGIETLPDYTSGSSFVNSLDFVGSVLQKSFTFLSTNYIVGSVSILDFILGALFVLFLISFFLLGTKR